MLARRHTLWGVLFCTGWLLAGDKLAGPAHAAVPNLKPGTQKHGAKEVLELHKAKSILEKADHDYDGHRVKAIGDIEKAIHALHHHSGTAGKSEKPTASKPETPATKPREKPEGKGGKEPQTKSDSELREAMQILVEVEKQLHQNHAKGGGEHHAKAAKDVERALEQLHDALKIR